MPADVLNAAARQRARELRAAGFAAGIQEAARMAREHGAIYFSEPRPCTCKPDCALVTSQRMPFADLLLNLKGNPGGS
jgi:hypothetical protein